MELRLVSEGIPQDEAHVYTSQKYNYARESYEYYQSLKISIDHEDPMISGAITMLQWTTH